MLQSHYNSVIEILIKVEVTLIQHQRYMKRHIRCMIYERCKNVLVAVCIHEKCIPRIVIVTNSRHQQLVSRGHRRKQDTGILISAEFRQHSKATRAIDNRENLSNAESEAILILGFALAAMAPMVLYFNSHCVRR
ncbi:hypothetical protein DMN91_004977 [Ooceraea biroi]|uniref:Uncharacterized protein n=1 Tax=Ooceraea biroi TaxID=2015173 RepID=A0A3L8DS62_OOCBI|nr:uncharacterized protein LOC105280936 [Ooceraea biroi]RLU22699.1 hypothetical protein DMN91_004977 [Ooceraea biroi]